MYEAFFGLTDNPFQIAPDPRFLYMSERHKEALAHLLYGLSRQGGIIVLTGEVGTGKTTICRKFLQSIPSSTEIAFIMYPKLTARELLAALCDEFSLPYPAQATTKTLVDRIYAHLLDCHAAGKHCALIIDEAQNLSIDVLEQLRLLTNLETEKKKLLQIVLLGQPELQDLLAKNELRQLAQRVTARYHLGELSPQDLPQYLAFRLNVAGCQRQLFNAGAIREITRKSRGIPRLVNLIADRALLGAYSENSSLVDRARVKQAVKEIGPVGLPRNNVWWHHWLFKGTATGILAGILMLSLLFMLRNAYHTPASEADVVAVAPPQPVGIQPTLAPSGVAKKLPEQAGPIAEPSASLDRQEMNSTEKFSPESADIEESIASVMSTWGLQPSDRLADLKSLCDWVESQGLACLERTGNWRSLERLNRPALLNLTDVQGRQYTLGIVEIDGDNATVSLGGELVQTTLRELDRYWLGEYQIIWKVPPFKSRIIGPGDIQDKNVWLSLRLDALASLLGETEQGTDLSKELASTNSGGLTGRVKAFQRMAGITPDGIAGTMTYIMLNTWTDPDVPLLIKARASEDISADRPLIRKAEES